MAIKVNKELRIPTQYPICNARSIDKAGRRNKPSIVCVYAVIDKPRNVIGYLCRNCGYYKIDFEVKIGDE